MTDRDDDQALNRFYRDRSGEEPPAALDRVIRDRARREARREAQPPAGETPSRPWLRVGRWSGLATAAVLVLALATVLRIEDPVPSPSPRDDSAFIDGESPDASATAPEAIADTAAGHAPSAGAAAAAAAAEAAPQRAAGRPTVPQREVTALKGSAPLRAPQEPAAPAGADRSEARVAREQPATAAASCPAARTLTTASGDRYRLCSGSAGTTLRHDGCATPWPLPPDGEVAAGQFGIRLAAGGETATLYCRDGRWDLEPGPERLPPAR